MKIAYNRKVTDKEQEKIEQYVKTKFYYHHMILKLGVYDNEIKEEGINAIVEHLRLNIPLVFDDHGNLDYRFVVFLIVSEMRNFSIDSEIEKRIIETYIRLHISQYLDADDPLIQNDQNKKKSRKLH